MYDDEQYQDPFDAAENQETPPGFLRRHGCLFMAVTTLVIVSLVGTSLAAWFVVGRQTRPAVTPAPPTLAPATLVAALPTPRPTTAQPTAAPAAGPVVNRIVIVNAEGQVETLSPTGQDRRVLTREGSRIFFQFPTWSPDGQRLAVIGSDFSGGGIYVLPDAAASGAVSERQVYFSDDETPIYLYWSPDSTQLAFLANQSSNRMGLKLVDSDGIGDSRLLATGAPFYWDWSDDSQQLLIHSGANRGTGAVSLIDVDGQTQAGNVATPGVFQAPDIAAGGRYWAFAEQTDDLSALVVVDTQTGERRSFEPSDSLALGWSPAGDQLAFTTGSGESGHPFWGPLRLLDVASGQTHLLARQAVLAFFWSPDGRSIAYITLNGGPDDGVTALAKTRHLARAIQPAQQTQGFLSLSIVDVVTGQGLRLLDFEPTLLFLSQFLPFFDQYALSHHLWSPDSSALVLPVRQDETNVVLVVPVSGGRPFFLAEGDIAFWSQR